MKPRNLEGSFFIKTLAPFIKIWHFIEQNTFASARNIEKVEIDKVALNIHSLLMHFFFINLGYHIYFIISSVFIFIQFGPDPVSSYQERIFFQ